jgi:hypothetical protein
MLSLKRQSQNAPLDTNSVNENEGRDMGIHKAKEIPFDETQALSPYMLENTP